MIFPFNATAIEDIAARLDLRGPNRRALTAVAEALDAGEPGLEIVCDLATATGKTYIAAGVIDYLAAAGVRNVLIVCPGTTILNKTVTNFTPGHAKFVDGLEVITAGRTSEDFQRGSVSEALGPRSRPAVAVRPAHRPPDARHRRGASGGMSCAPAS